MNVLVIGASGGIGLALTRQYLDGGHNVLATWRDSVRATSLLELAKHHVGRLQLLRLDVTDFDASDLLSRAARRHCVSLDLLIHAAGLFPAGERIGRLDANSISKAFSINAVAPLLLTQALLPLLFASRRPRVIFFTSDLASDSGPVCPGAYSYPASKAAMTRLAQMLANDLRPSGIVVTIINPGWTRTRMGGGQAPHEPDETASRLRSIIEGLSVAESGQILACWE